MPLPLRLRLIVGLLFVLLVYVAIVWPTSTVYLLVGIFACVALVDKLFQQQPKLERKSRRQSKKHDDDIPDDPTWDQLRATLGRMAQGPSTHTHSTEPQQLTLFGGAVPVKSEQIVRQNNRSVPEEPAWFAESFKH